MSGEIRRFRDVVVPYDFSEHSEAALSLALDLAGPVGATTIHLVHVLQLPLHLFAATVPTGAASMPLAADPMDSARLREAADEAIAPVAERVEKHFDGEVRTHAVEGAAVADHVLATADSVGADLIVMGTHGRTGLAHVFLGSVTERTLRRAKCPVLTVQAPEDDAEADGGTHD